MRLQTVTKTMAFALAIGSAACAPRNSTTTAAPSAAAASSGESVPREHVAKQQAARAEAQRDQPTVELALEQLASGHIVVPLRTGVHPPMRFILDTGASTSVITRRTQDTLGFRDEDGTPVKGQGADGALSDVRLFTLGELQVGSRTYEDLTVAVMDLAHLEEKLETRLDGILGRNFLERHDLEVDFAARVLRLHAAGSVEAGKVDVARMAASEFGSFRGGLIRIEVRIDGSPALPAVLDLGAARSVMNWRAAKSLGLHRRSKGLDEDVDPLYGAGNTPIETRARAFGHIRVGEARIANPTLYIADLGVFQALGVANGPAMVFGLDMLRGRTLVIDYHRKQVFISPEAP